jgi:hypothetical protein
MIRIRIRRRGWLASPFVGVALALVLAGQAVATSWTAPHRVANAYWFDGAAFPGGSTAYVVFTKPVDCDFCGDKVYLRRSSDGGATWPYRYVLPGNNQDAAIAARGRHVDLVWASESDSGLFYAHSGDRGQSFGPRRAFSENYSETEPHVARGPGGLVAICWGEWVSDNDISCRVSTNGGATFGKKSSFPTSVVEVSAMAVGDGVVYVAYHRGQRTLVVRRSTDGGATWPIALEITDGESAYSPSLAADGDRAYVAYATVNANEHLQVRVRRTVNAGASWSAPTLMAPDTVSPGQPNVSVANGVVRGLFATHDGVFYTQSPDGVTWTAPEKVARSALDTAVGYAGKPIVVYQRGFAVFSTSRQ